MAILLMHDGLIMVCMAIAGLGGYYLYKKDGPAAALATIIGGLFLAMMHS